MPKGKLLDRYYSSWPNVYAFDMIKSFNVWVHTTWVGLDLANSALGC